MHHALFSMRRPFKRLTFQAGAGIFGHNGVERDISGKHSMTDEDIRWIQRLSNYSRALSQLREFIRKGELNKFEEQGLIKAFEYTYELGWNTIKDYFEAQGETDIQGSRDAFRLAFRRGIVEDGETWMDMIKSRTLTTHTYDEVVAREIASDIANRYFPEFEKLHSKMETFRKKAT